MPLPVGVPGFIGPPVPPADGSVFVWYQGRFQFLLPSQVPADEVVLDSAWQVQNATDTTKVLKTSLGGMTTGIALTLAPLSTTSQTLQFPNITATDTVATLGLSQTYTGVLTNSNATDATALGTGAVVLNSGGLSVAGQTQIGTKLTVGTGGATTQVTSTAGNLTAGARISAVDGAVATPSYTFTTNNTSGMSWASGLALIDQGVRILTLTNGANTFAAASTTTFGNTTSASTSLLGAVVIGNGSAATSIGMGNGTINAGGPITSGSSITSVAAASPAFVLTLGSTATSQITANNTYAMSFYDLVNAWGFLRYVAGTTATGTIGCQGTLAASSSTTGAFTVGNGVAATTVGIGGGNINAGGTLTVGGNITGSQSGTNTWQNTSTAGGSLLNLNAFTGNNNTIGFYINGANISSFAANATFGFEFYDATGHDAATYTRGTLGAGFWTFPCTLDASSSTVAANVMSGGLAVAKSINAGGALTVGGNISTTNGSIISNGAAAYMEVITSAATAAYYLAPGSTNVGALVGTSTYIAIKDQVNNWYPIQYTIGTQAAGAVGFTGTLDASSSTVAANVMSGGLAVKKNTISAQGLGWGVTINATVAGTITLTSASKVMQTFTGSTAGTIVQFPAANAFGAGVSVIYIVNNQSTQTVTPTRAGADTFQGGGTTDPVTTGTTTRYASDGVSVWLKW